MERVLVSSCLLGRKVRYNGSARWNANIILDRWSRDERIVPICPEVAAGFSTPRPPAEITDSSGGQAVWAGTAQIVEDNGRDVTDLYKIAGEMTFALAMREGCRYALLTDGSPSCGSRFIYDGTFTGKTIAGQGSTAAFLEQHGIRVFAESMIGELDVLLYSRR